VDRSARGRAVWEAVAALAAVVAALAAVIGLVLASDDDGDDDDAGASTTTDGPGGSGTSATTDDTAGGSTTTDGGTASTTTTIDEVGPDLAVFLEGRCDVIGGGALSGADVLNIYLRVRSVGEEEVDTTVRTAATSDTGLVGQAIHGVSDSAASVALQVDLAPQDYGRTHRIEVETEATQALDETDRDNNIAELELTLPASPPGSGQVIEPC
jgi:hypothetical protein